MRDREVITFGSATYDIFAETSKERIVHLHTEGEEENLIAYKSGDKVLIDELHYEIGGGGTNTAATLNKLGIPVAYCGCVGNDKHGEDIIQWLEKQGIPFLGHRTDTPTNVSVILDSKKLHDRSILVYKGASGELSSDQLRFEALDSTWFYFSSLLYKSYETMIHLMRHAKNVGIAVAFNPSNYQTQQGLESLQEPITLANLLVMNKDEAEELVGEGDREELLIRLREAGGEIVLITDAAHGASVYYHDTIFHAPANEDVNVVETTGAGDCFASTFLGGLVMGLGPDQALVMGLINAESLISVVGAKNGLLGKEDALRLLEKDERVVEQRKI